MDSTFTTCLWKEWREQRRSLLALIPVVPLLLFLASLWREHDLLADPALPLCAAAAGMLVCFMAIGGDLLPRDMPAERHAFLERLPAGTTPVYLAKLALFSASILLAALWGYVIAILVHAPGALWPAVPTHERFLLGAGIPIFAFFAWSWAASLWVPRGALAPFAGAIAVVTLCWPLWLYFVGQRTLAARAWEPAAFALSCLLGAGLAGWATFVVGRRREGTPRRSTMVGIGVAALVMLPSWAWTGWRWYAATNLRPGSSEFTILNAVLGADGRFAFLTASQADGKDEAWRLPQTRHALIIDLESGEWRDAGGPGTSFYPEFASQEQRRIAGHGPYETVRLHREDQQSADSFFEGRTAEPLPGPPLRLHASEASRPWGESGMNALVPCGLGLLLSEVENGRVSEGGWWDPSRKRVYRKDELFESSRSVEVLVRPGPWVIRERRDSPWRSLDPDTGERHPFSCLDPGDQIGPMLTDGSLLVVHAGRPARFDPQSDSLTPISFADGWSGRLRWVRSGYHQPLPVSLKAPVVYLVPERQDTPCWSGLSLLDPERGELEHLPYEGDGRSGLLGLIEDRVAFVLEAQSRIVSIDLASRERRVLFPRE
jgi:hypothetical protein